MSSPVASPTTMRTPPRVPALRADSLTLAVPPRAQLLWVRTGTAHVRLGDAVEFRLARGEGVWMPAGMHRQIVTEPGTVAFPLRLDDGVGGRLPPEPTPFTVPDDWQDWLIQHFNLQVTPLGGHGYSQDALAELLQRPRSRPSAPRRGGAPEAPAMHDATVMPQAVGARAVAEELLRDPALELTVDEWATRVASSPRSLRRDFAAATGLTFEQWRLRCRLNAGVEFLTAGYDVDQTAAQVGFATGNGFARAFKQRYGITPRELSRKVGSGAAPGELSERATAARQAGDLARMVGTDASPVAPELLPPADTPSHANDVHVLSWMYRGSGYVDVGDRRYERSRGVATWIPAGVEHTTGIRENSISLPIGTATAGELTLTAPLQVQFSPAWDDYLMFCSISSRSALQPEEDEPHHILDLFGEQVAAQQALTVPMPTHPSARDAAMRYLRGIGASGGSAPIDLPADLHRTFRDETGMTFARWRYAARMRIARDLLAGGAKPSVVARRVGYAHLPTFSAAFHRFHGISPREYCAQQSERA